MRARLTSSYRAVTREPTEANSMLAVLFPKTGWLSTASQKKIASAIVHRSDLTARIDFSLGMRLKTIGVTYR